MHNGWLAGYNSDSFNIMSESLYVWVCPSGFSFFLVFPFQVYFSESLYLWASPPAPKSLGHQVYLWISTRVITSLSLSTESLYLWISLSWVSHFCLLHLWEVFFSVKFFPACTRICLKFRIEFMNRVKIWAWVLLFNLHDYGEALG